MGGERSSVCPRKSHDFFFILLLFIILFSSSSSPSSSVYRLMEQQLHVLRLNVQSEQGILEDRCSGMEVTMETLKEHNLRLQRSLMQVNTKVYTHRYTQTHR